MLYEHRKHDGSLPLVGVNTFLDPAPATQAATIPLARSTEEEKQRQLQRLAQFREQHRGEAPQLLARLQDAALRGENLFAVLMDAVRCCTLGELTSALFAAGGRYRRNV